VKSKFPYLEKCPTASEEPAKKSDDDSGSGHTAEEADENVIVDTVKQMKKRG